MTFPTPSQIIHQLDQHVLDQQRPSLIVRLLEELQTRKATLNEFYLARIYRNTYNLQACLHYLDYLRLKKRDDS